MAPKHLIILLNFAAFTTFTSAGSYDDQIAILQGVKTVVTSQSSGFLCVYGDNSFPILMGHRNGVAEPVAVGGRFGKGRIAAFGHDAALDREDKSNAVSDRKKFFENLFDWVASGKKNSVLFIWGCHDRTETKETLSPLFKSVESVYISWKNSNIDKDLATYDAVVVLGEFSEGIVQKLRSYVDGGGGLVMANTNWWYGTMRNGNLKKWPPRTVSEDAGFIWKGAAQEYTDGDSTANLTSALGTFKGPCVPSNKG